MKRGFDLAARSPVGAGLVALARHASSMLPTLSGPAMTTSLVIEARPSALFAPLRGVRRLAFRLGCTRRRRAVLLSVVLLPVALILFPAAWLVHHVFFDRTGLPDLESFIRFELPTIGVVRDANGTALIELAREYRRVVSYNDVPPILRQAILAAEDKSFFTHCGVDYSALPRVVHRTAARSLAE